MLGNRTADKSVGDVLPGQVVVGNQVFELIRFVGGLDADAVHAADDLALAGLVVLIPELRDLRHSCLVPEHSRDTHDRKRLFFDYFVIHNKTAFQCKFNFERGVRSCRRSFFSNSGGRDAVKANKCLAEAVG